MRRSTLPLVVAMAGLFGLLLAAPAGAATTGTVCGQVTAFAAPTAVADGGITIDGTAEIIDSTALAAISATTLTVLNTVAAADATTCVDITANGEGEIVDIEIAAQAEICGAVTADTVLDVYTVAGVTVPAALISADADLAALLNAAAVAGATVCLDVTIDGTTGLFTSVALDATIDLCGDATLDADSVTIGGVDVPLALLDAEAQAALAVAIAAGADVCLSVVVDNTDLVQANLTANVDLCGEVTLDANGDVVVDGVVIPDALLNANAAALLELAAEADGTACASVDVSSTGGDTTVGVTVTIEVCAEVTAVTDDSVTIGGITFVFAGAAAAGLEVGDDVCVAATTSPTGNPIITDVDVDEGQGPAAPASPSAPVAGGGGMLPDTAAVQASETTTSIGAMLLIVVAAVAAAMVAVRSMGHARG